MSDSDHHQHGDGNGNGDMTKNSSNDKPTFRLSRYRYQSSAITNGRFKSSSLTSKSTSTTTIKTNKTKTNGGLAVDRSSRKHSQHLHHSRKNSYLRTDQRTQFNNKSRSDGSSSSSSSSSSRNSNSSRNRSRKRDLHEGRRIGIQTTEMNADENDDGGRGTGKDCTSSTSFLFEEDDEVDDTSSLDDLDSDSCRRFGDNGDESNNDNNNDKKKSTGPRRRRRRRSRSEVLASIVGSDLNNSKISKYSFAGHAARQSHRRNNNNNNSTKSEAIEHSNHDVGGERRVEEGRMMKKRIREMASSSSSSPSSPYDKDGEEDDDDDELRRLEQAFFDDMEDDEKDEPGRLGNGKTSSEEPRRTATTLRLDDSSDEDDDDKESDDRDGELQQNAATHPTPTIVRNGSGSKNDNDVKSNEQSWIKSANANETSNKAPSFPVDTAASETSDKKIDVDLNVARQAHHIQHPNKNKKIDSLEREVDNLFIRSDQRTSTVKTFTKSLEAHIGKKLTKDEKKKVKDRLISLVNQVVVPIPTVTTTAKTTTAISMNNNQFKTIDGDKGDNSTGEELTNAGISKLTIENANHHTHTEVDAMSHRIEDTSTKQLTDRDGKSVEQWQSAGATGNNTPYHTGSIQSRSDCTTMHRRPSKKLTVTSEGQSTGRKSTDGECLHDENRSTRSGKSASTSTSDDIMDKKMSAGSSSGGPLEDNSTGINGIPTLPDPEVPTAENCPRQNEEISVMTNPKRQPRKRKKSDNKHDTTLSNESATETRAKPKRQTKKVKSNVRDVENIDVDEARASEEGVAAASKHASKANDQTKKVSEKTEPAPRPKKRARTKACALCKTCPCQKASTSQDHAVPLDMSSTFSRSDAAVEKALIRRLQKLEKSVEHAAEQREMVRRNLKKHRRDIWKRKEKETSMDGRSGWSASAVVPVGAGGKIQTYAAPGVDEEAWFLPDAKIFEQQQTDSVKTHQGIVKKAQLMLYKTVPLKQPSLLQMGFSLEKFLDGDEHTDRTTETAQDEKDNADRPAGNSDGATDIGHDSAIDTTSGWNEGDENDSDEEGPNEETCTGDQEHDDIIVRSSWHEGGSPQHEGGEEVERTETTWIKNAMMHDSWPNTSTKENSQSPLSFVTDFDKLFQDLDPHSFGTILDINAEEESTESSHNSGVGFHNDENAAGSANDHINLSLLSQVAQETVQEIWSSVGKDHERVMRLQESAPEWKENCIFAFHQKNPATIDKALDNIRKKRRRMEEMKQVLLDAWEREDTALEVFENALEKSSARSRRRVSQL